jgi:hypothetical protein
MAYEPEAQVMSTNRDLIQVLKLRLQTLRRAKLLLVLFCSLFAAINPAFAQTWTQVGETPGNVYAVACSADGAKWVTASGHTIYISTNSGTTWTQTSATNGPWSPVSISADGTKLVAAFLGTGTYTSIYTSTNSGATWISNNVPALLDSYAYAITSIALSADGNKLAAAANPRNGYSGQIFTSTDAGATWIQASVSNQDWISVASSADGTKLVAVAATPAVAEGIPPAGPIYTSTNSGTTWMLSTAPSNNWRCVASSADGTKLVAGSFSGPIFTSTDSGTTWTQSSAPDGSWYSIASSADGTKLIAANGYYINGDYIITSTNSGSTWTQNNAPSTSWTWVASSADGNEMAAVGGASPNRLIYTAQITPAPTLNITPTNGNLLLSWIIPSTDFVLQQSCDLQNWTDVTNQPVLNLTNLQDEVSLSPSTSNCFYRLAVPRL